MAEPVVWSWYVNRNREAPIGLESDTAPKLDGPLGKLAKLFPLEVITVFTGADQFARAAEGDLRFILLAAVAVAGLVLLPGAFSKFRGVKWSDNQGRVQIGIGALAYLMWVYGQGTLSAELGIYNALVAGVAIFIFLGIALVYGPNQPGD